MDPRTIVDDRPFEELADSAPVMLWRINSSFDCDWANAAWFEYTGGSLAEQSGFAWVDLVHPEDSDRIVEAFGRAFEAREPVSVELRVRGRDGRYRWFLDSGAPCYNDGVFAGFVGSCIDITDHKEAEERTRLLGLEMLRLARFSPSGAYAVAILPDLTGALQEIKNAADAIASGGAVPEQLARIRRSVVRAQALARKGRNSTAWPHPLVRTDLATALRSAEEAILAHPDAAGVVIDWDLASGLCVEANSLELQLVLVSLAHNALEAMRGAPARQLRISTAAWGALAIVTLTDSGPGVPADLRQALSRLESDGDASGVGSGWYLSQRLVAAHRGRLWAEQGPGGGAVVKFTLPLAP